MRHPIALGSEPSLGSCRLFITLIFVRSSLSYSTLTCSSSVRRQSPTVSKSRSGRMKHGKGTGKLDLLHPQPQMLDFAHQNENVVFSIFDDDDDDGDGNGNICRAFGGTQHIGH